MTIHDLQRPILRRLRKKRMKLFQRLMQPTDGDRIIDVGGNTFNWRIADVRPQVLLVNVIPQAEGDQLPENLKAEIGDGTALTHADDSFDIAFSNSVIEHVGPFGKQAAFANEMRRVGKKVWVQTPARWFLLEPHVMAPFIHYLPKRWQYYLLPLTIWGIVQRPTPSQRQAFLSGTRLLTCREMRMLFPDCEIYCERFLGLARSYIAIRR